MTREDAFAKGRRYLTEGRLTVVALDDESVSATCRGSGESYLLGHNAESGWWCSCLARGVCSHLHALMAVTTRERSDGF